MIAAVRNQNPILKKYKEKNRTKYKVEIIMVLLWCYLPMKASVPELQLLPTAFGSLS